MSLSLVFESWWLSTAHWAEHFLKLNVQFFFCSNPWIIFWMKVFWADEIFTRSFVQRTIQFFTWTSFKMFDHWTFEQTKYLLEVLCKGQFNFVRELHLKCLIIELGNFFLVWSNYVKVVWCSIASLVNRDNYQLPI